MSLNVKEEPKCPWRKNHSRHAPFADRTETVSSSKGVLEHDLLSQVDNLDKYNLIFRYLQNRSRVQVWLYEQTNLRIEGCIAGFDEYMNLVLDEAEEVHMKTKQRKTLGRILLKGDNITLIQAVQ